MGDLDINKDFLRWEVKPLWILRFPSQIVVELTAQKQVEIYGVNRSVGDITRDWEIIHSVEEFRQGYVAKPSDIRFTIALKEHGKAYEILRRLAKGGILFDVECTIIDNDDYLDNPITPTNLTTGAVFNWMRGFERYVGCVVSRESQTIDIAEFPVREFECLALRHQLLSDGALSMLIEGGGTFDGVNALIDVKVIEGE